MTSRLAGRPGDAAVTADIAIVGAGFSGLGMAIQLKNAGRQDFVILEKAGDVGGTWRDNTYPGCACDIRSLLYSYSFAPRHDWSRLFPAQPEILSYLRGCADRYGLRPHIRFGAEVTAAAYDDVTGRWLLRTADGDAVGCRALILAMGPLHQPLVPEIPGAETFAGRQFHSARWDHASDLSGRSVAVIGAGASAVQLIPRVAERAAAVSVFQRTPPWIVPKPDRELTERAHRLFRALPSVQRGYRYLIYWQQELMGLCLAHPRLAAAGEALARWHIRRQIGDPALRERVTPGYRFGCKRVLVSSDYYPALTRPNVELVTEPITAIVPDGVMTAGGALHRADVIVYATGFRLTGAFDRAGITGAGGLRLQDAWRDGMEAYLGITVAGFPNLFLMLGPNSGLGHNSMIFMIEAQARYVLRCLDLIDVLGPVSVRPEVQRRFNERLQRRLRRAVWSAGGCVSWYLDSRGVNRALWPGSTVGYWLATRRLSPGDYRMAAPERPGERVAA